MKKIIKFFLLTLVLLGTRYFFAAVIHNTLSPQVLLFSVDVFESRQIIEIASNLYSSDTTATSIYPLYPLLIRGLSRVIGDGVSIEVLFAIGIALTVVFFSIALYILDSILEMLWLFDDKKYFVIGLTIFAPMAFYYSMVSADALFLMLSLACIYYLFKKKYFGSSVFLGLTILTSALGYLLLLPFLFHFLICERYNDKINKYASVVLYLTLALVPVALFYFYLWQNSGDYFMAIRAHLYQLNLTLVPFGRIYEIAQNSGVGNLLAVTDTLLLVLLLVVVATAFFKIYMIFEHRTMEQNTLFVYALLYTFVLGSIRGDISILRLASLCASYLIIASIIYNVQVRNSIYLGILFFSVSLQTLFFLNFLGN